MLQEHLDKKISSVDSANYRLEGPFFKERVVPAVHKFLLSLNYNKDQARNALLAEGFRDPLIKDFVSGAHPAVPDTHSRREYPER
jgi:hypothetical protein